MSKLRKILLVALTALSIGITALAFAKAHKGKNRTAQSERVAAHDVTDVSSMPPQGLQARGPAEIVRFTVSHLGLRPFVAHASPGWVAIYLEDRARSSAGLVVQAESGAPVGQLVRREGRWRDGSRIFFLRGRYKILEASHPTNTATLIIEP